MLRSILAVLAGIVSAAIVVSLVEAGVSALYPPPAGLNMGDPAALEAYIQQAPFGAMALVVAGWFAGAVVGVGLACRIAKGSMRVAAVVSVLQMAAVVSNFFELSHPLWMIVSGSVLSVAGCALGAWLGRPSP